MIELKRDGTIFCWKMIFRLLIVHNGFLECVSIYAQELYSIRKLYACYIVFLRFTHVEVQVNSCPA